MNIQIFNGANTAVTRTSIQSRFGHTVGGGGGGSSTAAPSSSSTAQSLSTGSRTGLISIGSFDVEARALAEQDGSEAHGVGHLLHTLDKATDTGGWSFLIPPEFLGDQHEHS